MSSSDYSRAGGHRSERRLLAVLAGISLLALAARVVGLGSRVAHWDEGRVAYRILETMQTGEWSYSPIIHGPFFPRVNPLFFEALGPSDFSMRLVVALLGAALPLSAWLFRSRLRDSEVVALALLFAANPALLYFSRFMRNDVPLITFMIFALGLYVRAIDTRRTGYLYAGTGMLALAFTTKATVLVHLVTWAGALVLLFDHRLFRARDRDRRWPDVFKARVRGTAAGLWAWKLPLLVALVEFLVVVVFFFAPRPAFWQAFGDPTMFPEIVHQATVGTWNETIDRWVGSATEEGNVYLDYAKPFWETVFFAGAPVFALSVAGFVADRYSVDGPRDIVSLGFYWGIVMGLGYPIITDIDAPWGVIHTLAPLAFPAAVGLALVYRWGREALADDDRLGVGLAAVLLLLVGWQVGATAVQTSYLDPHSVDNDLVQYVQPPPELRDALEDVQTASVRNADGPDVLFYGKYADDWYARLPLPWYLERYGTEIAEAEEPSQIGANPPPVIIADGETHSDARAERQELEERIDGYEKTTYGMAYRTKQITVYVDRDRVPASG